MQQLAFWFDDRIATKPAKKVGLPLSLQQQKVLAQLASPSTTHVIGIDEVGMGAWAGPVVVAGVVLPKGWAHPAVKDSKQLTHNQRLSAWQKHILPNLVASCVLVQPAEAVDREGVIEVQRRLTESCALYCRQRVPGGTVVQDGDAPVSVDGSSKGVLWMPRADEVVPAVSAASILAKVTRDRWMHEVSEIYPGYGFDTNVGYHSEKHKKGLERLGPTPIHRMTFRPVQAYVRAKKLSSW